MIPKLSFIPQALDKWFEKGDNYISVEEIRLKQNIGIFRNTASHFFARSTEKRGVNPRRRNGTVRCDALSDGAAAQSLAGAGKALRKERAFAPRTESGYSVPIFSPAFPAERMRVHKNVCTEAFVALVLFYCDFRSRTAPILYCVKNDVFCLQAAITAFRLIANIEKEK